jgi:hypothetical protein
VTVTSIALSAGQKKSLDLKLSIETQQQQVKVGDEEPGTDPSRNSDALVLKGNDLSTLSNDPKQMLQQLQGMAGDSDSSSPHLYIDGFSNGKMPPKSAIREIRINQNPYSAQYDEMGYGRIEVFTKPGADTLHGDYSAYGGDSALDSRNPYSPLPQPFYSVHNGGDLSGPLTKQSSYFLSFSREDNQNSAIVSAETLDIDGNQIAFTDSISNPSASTSFSSRLDLQLTKADTFSSRYQFDRASQTNAGVGQLLLASQAFDNLATTQTFQAGDTHIFGEKIVNELRFQYIRTRATQAAANSDPTLIVQGTFTGGGNNLGQFTDNQDQYEIQNYSSIDLHDHFLRLGVRQRLNRDSNRSTAGYNGEYIFSSLDAYQVTVKGIKAGLRPAEIRAAGGGASQFNITVGDPSAAILVSDTALYAEDSWKARKDLTLNYGLRFESQSRIADHADLAPRLGFTYGIGGTDKKPAIYTIEGGFGIFYDRFPSANILTVTKQNGVRQQQYVLNSPDTYPNIPPLGELSAQTGSAIFQTSPHYRSPYDMEGTINLSRRLGEHGRTTVGYRTARGVHQLMTRNINAPLPGTYDPADPTSGVRPLGGTQNVYEYDTIGLSRRNRIYVNEFFRVGDKISLYASYSFGYRRSDTSGGFPSNQYDVSVDYGRAAGDVRHRVFMGGYFNLPHGFSGGPFLVVQSSSPFNIVVGQDLNGDSQFNDRPAFATDLSRPSVVKTRFGTFDTLPIAGQRIIPINYGRGPGFLRLDTNLGKSFHFGPTVKPPAGAPPPPPPPAGSKAEPPERRYTLSAGVEIDNLLNHVNPAPPIGTLGSPLFGQSNALNSFFSNGGSANRTLNFQVDFRF